VQDPGRIRTLLGTTAKLTFHLLDESVSQTMSGRGARVPPGVELLPGTDRGESELYPIRRRAMLEGDRLIDAAASQPTISINNSIMRQTSPCCQR